MRSPKYLGIANKRCGTEARRLNPATNFGHVGPVFVTELTLQIGLFTQDHGVVGNENCHDTKSRIQTLSTTMPKPKYSMESAT